MKQVFKNVFRESRNPFSICANLASQFAPNLWRNGQIANCAKILAHVFRDFCAKKVRQKS